MSFPFIAKLARDLPVFGDVRNKCIFKKTDTNISKDSMVLIEGADVFSFDHTERTFFRFRFDGEVHYLLFDSLDMFQPPEPGEETPTLH